MSDTATERAHLGEVHEVRAHFADSERMQDAISRLSVAGFDRADISLPDPVDLGPDSGAQAADTEEDARQARTVHTSGVASAAAIAAAGITVATGGAALPAAAAAIAAGGLLGGATWAASSAANADTQADRDAKAASGLLVLSVRAPTPAKRAEAETLLRQAGGTDIEVS